MKRSNVFQLRLTDAEAERLEAEVAERGLASKADRIREALGWKKADKTPHPARRRPIATPTEQPADPDRQPGLAAMQQLAKRLKGGS
jgi:hypothetical protein